MRPEIHLTRRSNPRPRGATQGPQPSGLRTPLYMFAKMANFATYLPFAPKGWPNSDACPLSFNFQP
jgi:hypothetical protein